MSGTSADLFARKNGADKTERKKKTEKKHDNEKVDFIWSNKWKTKSSAVIVMMNGCVMMTVTHGYLLRVTVYCSDHCTNSRMQTKKKIHYCVLKMLEFSSCELYI